MDLQKAILAAHTHQQAHNIADYVDNNTSRFKALVYVYLAGPYRITQRASWPLSICVERHPQLVKPHLKKIISYLDTPNVHDAVKRNTLRLLQTCELPKSYYGQVANLCFQYLQANSTPIAIKAFAITVLGRIVATQPDLGNELRIILEDQLPYASPAFIVRAKRVLKSLAVTPVH